ncbi:hypothetical protein CERSUDRAFT_75312 [Gelatoporia subvermispora B]|uniref:Uncharacterized protein n=1 Tax=Ceriporiopsis subvermispora (strain B) TaxID=914234 RepID=M2QSH5_CERS8|nr:hypothetical protein CERSUDRAFT_75312 [Gelatoporia subvermispora B]
MVTTRNSNATKHPGLRAMGDPDELAEAAARKEEKLAKQAQRARDANEKKTRTKKVARFEDDMLEEEEAEKRRATEIRRPRAKKKGSSHCDGSVSESREPVQTAEDPGPTNNNNARAEASSQVEPDEVSMDGASETESVKKKTSKKKASARDDIETLRTRRKTGCVVESESETDEMERETPRASKTRGKNKGTANRGFEELWSRVPSPSYNSKFVDDVSSAQWGSKTSRISTSSNRSSSATSHKATESAACRGRGRERRAGNTGRGGRGGRVEQDNTEISQEAAMSEDREISAAENDGANQDTSSGTVAGAKRGHRGGRGRGGGQGRGGREERGGGHTHGGRIVPAAAEVNNHDNHDEDEDEDEEEEGEEGEDDEEDEEEPAEEEEAEEVVDKSVTAHAQPRRLLPGGRSRGDKRGSDPANHPATRYITETREATPAVLLSSSGGRGKVSKRSSDAMIDDPPRTSKRSKPSPMSDVFDSNNDNTSMSSGSKKRTSPSNDSDYDDGYADKHKRLRADKNSWPLTMTPRDATSQVMISANLPSTVRSRADRRQSLFGFDSPRFQGSRRPIPIIIPDTPVPAPRKGKATAPAVLMPSPTPIRVSKSSRDDPSGPRGGDSSGPRDGHPSRLFDSDEEVERHAAMASPLRAVEHRKTSLNMVGVKTNLPSSDGEEVKTKKKPKKKKATAEQAGAAPRSSEDVSEKDKHPKAKLEDLPSKIQDEWPTFGATYNKWATSRKNPFDITPEESRDAIESIYYFLFGNRHAGDGSGPPFSVRTPVVEYCRQHFNQYKNHMSGTAVIALNAFFDHPSNAARFDTMEKRQRYAHDQLDEDQFIYRAFTHIDGIAAAAGAFCSSLVLACFGVHFDKVDGADEDIHLLHDEDGKELRPVGGLALAAASVERALEAYASGRVAFAEDQPDGSKKKTKKKKNSSSSKEDLYFSRDNYGDDVDDYAEATKEMTNAQWDEVMKLGMTYGSKYRRINQGSSQSTGPATAPETTSNSGKKVMRKQDNLSAYKVTQSALQVAQKLKVAPKWEKKKKRYLKEVKEGPYGFRLYAIWLSTPKILFMWAVMTPSLEVQFWLGVPVRSYGPALLATALAVIGGVASQRGPILHVAKKMYKSYVQPSPQSSPRVQSINTVIDAPGAPRAKTVVKAPGAHSTETVADIV